MKKNKLTIFSALLIIFFVINLNLAHAISLDANELPANTIIEQISTVVPGQNPFVPTLPVITTFEPQDFNNNLDEIMINEEMPNIYYVLAQPIELIQERPRIISEDRDPIRNEGKGRTLVDDGDLISNRQPINPINPTLDPEISIRDLIDDREHINPITPEYVNMFERSDLTPTQDSQFRSAVESNGGVVLEKMENVPAAYVVAFEEQEDAESFKNNPMVFRLFYESYFTPQLYQSRPLINADIATQDFNSGEGVKIAIIDTGIDSSANGFDTGMNGANGPISRVSDGHFFGGELGYFLNQEALVMQPWQDEIIIPFEIPEDYTGPINAELVFINYFDYNDDNTEGGLETMIGPDLDLYIVRPSWNNNVEMSIPIASSTRDTWENFTEEIYLEELNPGKYHLIVEKRPGTNSYYERTSTYFDSVVQEPIRFSAYVGKYPKYIQGDVYSTIPIWPQGAIQGLPGTDYKLGTYTYNGEEFQFVLSDAVEEYRHESLTFITLGYGYESLSIDLNHDGSFDDYHLTRNINYWGGGYSNMDHMRTFYGATAHNYSAAYDEESGEWYWDHSLYATNYLDPENEFTLGVIMHAEKWDGYSPAGTSRDSTYFNGERILFTEWNGFHNFFYGNNGSNVFTFKTPFDHANHGSHVAGIAAGAGQVPGIAPETSLYDAKVFGGIYHGNMMRWVCSFRVVDDPSSAIYCQSTESTESLAMQNAIIGAYENGADVISMSIGSTGRDGCYDYWISNFVHDFIEFYEVPIVLSAGNSGPDWGTISIPACVENAITVGATQRASVFEDVTLAPYSSRGPVDYSNDVIKPDVVAPGGDPSSAHILDGFWYFYNNGIASIEAKSNIAFTGTFDQYLSQNRYQKMSGTSMAAPHVTGIIALMLSENPDLTPTEIQQILHESSRLLENEIEPNNAFGYGLVDAYEAVSLASEL
ncbi:S8 family serine peptidase [archaeon]|nr:S8 family serine peptidase [archaeon]